MTVMRGRWEEFQELGMGLGQIPVRNEPCVAVTILPLLRMRK
jgi:hypothetical protein